MLTDKEILIKIKSLRAQEKFFTFQILELLEHIDRRKLYAELRCQSLFEYCMQVLDYSEAEAAVRVNATRLIKQRPEAKALLKDGELSLTTASQVQSFFRTEMPKEITRKQIIEEVKNKSKNETKKILEKYSSIKIETMRLDLNQRLTYKLKKVQENLQERSEYVALEVLFDKNIRDTKQPLSFREEKGSFNQRYISNQTRMAVLKSHNYECQNCGAKTHLELDHIKPISVGGNSNEENLQILCRNCNQRRYIKQKSSELGLSL